MIAVRALDDVMARGALWLYRARLGGLDWSGISEAQWMVRSRQHGTAFVTAAEHLSRVWQRAYEGLQARPGGFDDDQPAASRHAPASTDRGCRAKGRNSHAA
jgi:hypothetical protein